MPKAVMPALQDLESIKRRFGGGLLKVIKESLFKSFKAKACDVS
jgi:hypothetical protein